MSENSSVVKMLKDNIGLHQKVLSNILLLNQISEICNKIVLAIVSEKKVMACGNGGSAADAQHLIAELVGRFVKTRKGLPAVDLTSNAATMTAIANDYNYENVFRRQVESIGKNGDILIGISTSGNSKNIIEAFRYAKSCGIITVGLLGHNGGNLKDLSDIPLIVPHNETARIQEAHGTIIHIICALVENSLEGKGNE